jgi:OOP family OmpA-OmpF porin
LNDAKTYEIRRQKTGGFMIKLKGTLNPLFWGMLVLLSALGAYAQDESTPTENIQAELLQVPAGEKMKLEGTIVDQETDNLVLRGTGGGLYKVLTVGTEIKEKKSNPFRGARNYSKMDLLQGLHIEVKGSGDSSGSIVAKEIRLRNDDVLMARTMDTRVLPVENALRETQKRLDETEQKDQQLSGQVDELASFTRTVMGSAKAAQTSADGAMSEAQNAKSTADRATAKVNAANERISSLDDYKAGDVTIVNFKAGSAVLSEKEKKELDQFAESVNEKGYLIEVTGYASSDGAEALNRRLSRDRADAVIQYLADNHSIPLRRFIAPMGYGEKNPIADNATSVGRKENRRVEIRMLVSKGFLVNENSPSAAILR